MGLRLLLAATFPDVVLFQLCYLMGQKGQGELGVTFIKALLCTGHSLRVSPFFSYNKSVKKAPLKSHFREDQPQTHGAM